MNITIIAIGSRGDIVPYIALSQGLISAGHTICFATHLAYAELVRNYDIPFFPMSIAFWSECSRPYCLVVSFDSRCKATEFARTMFFEMFKPSVQLLRLSRSEHRDELLTQCIHLFHLTTRLADVFKSVLMCWSQSIGLFDKQKRCGHGEGFRPRR